MDSNISPDQTIFNMQQRLAHLEQMLQQAQPSAEQGPSAENPTSMDTNDTTETTDLHSLEVRPSYTWTPSEFLTGVLSLDEPIFTSPAITDEERKKTIERYPPIENLHYQPPDTVPVAARKMNRFQAKQDMSLKKLQYLLSGIFRPLDVLGLEISKDSNHDNAQRYLYMLADCRILLKNVATQINDLRNNIAFQAINPNFTNNNNSGNFTMDPSEFQAALVQQTSSAQAIQNAGNRNNRNRKRNFQNPRNFQAEGQTKPTSQFFRSGPSMDQGGYTNKGNNNNTNPFWNNNGNKNNNNNSNNNNNNNSGNNSSFNRQRNNKNPYLQTNRS
ncbi:hypothetical protein BD770DRAFT_400542 [Pilaira anomala]|nr:hypothetical protein BD770DRAFT_400542 [Pilaira anomala]